MATETKRKVLDNHGVPNKTVNGRLQVGYYIDGTEIPNEVEDITDWTRTELYNWLGY